MSRLATPRTVQATTCSTFTRNSSPNPILTTGPAAPLPRTPLVAGAPWAHTPLLTPTLKASGTATLSDPIPNSDRSHLYIIPTTLITKLASSPTPHGDGLDDLMHTPEFLFSRHFSDPIVWIHSIETGVGRERHHHQDHYTISCGSFSARFARFITLFDTQVGRFWHFWTGKVLHFELYLYTFASTPSSQLPFLQRLGVSIRGVLRRC
jgi:hypothetical protein